MSFYQYLVMGMFTNLLLSYLYVFNTSSNNVSLKSNMSCNTTLFNFTNENIVLTLSSLNNSTQLCDTLNINYDVAMMFLMMLISLNIILLAYLNISYKLSNPKTKSTEMNDAFMYKYKPIDDYFIKEN